MEVLFFVVVAGFLAAVMVVSFKMDAEQKKAWIALAERLELESDGSSIFGTLDGVDVSVATVVRGGGKHRHVFTVFEGELTNVPSGLYLSREGLLSKLGKVLGMDDIDLALPGLDERLLVRGDDPDEVRRWASRVDVSRALVELASGPAFEVENGRVTWEFSGTLATDDIEGQMRDIARSAKALSGGGYGALLDDGQW